MTREPTPLPVLLLRIVGLVGTLVLVTAGALALVAGFFEIRREDTARVLEGDPRALDVTTASGDVAVRVGAAGDPMSVTTLRRWSFDEPIVTTQVVDGTAQLDGRCRRGLLAGFSRCQVGFVVTVPPGGQVRVETSAGDVAVTGAVGGLTVRASAGDVTVAGAPGDVDVRTSAGDVRMRGLGAGPVEASADTGDVVLDFAASPSAVTADAQVGDVRVVVPDDGAAYRVVADVSLGKADVRVPQDPRATRVLRLSSAMGDVDVALGTVGPAAP